MIIYFIRTIFISRVIFFLLGKTKRKTVLLSQECCGVIWNRFFKFQSNFLMLLSCLLLHVILSIKRNFNAKYSNNELRLHGKNSKSISISFGAYLKCIVKPLSRLELYGWSYLAKLSKSSRSYKTENY